MIFPTLETLGPMHGYGFSARLDQVSGARCISTWAPCTPDKWGLRNEVSSAGDDVRPTAVGARDFMSSRPEGVENWRTNVKRDRVTAIMSQLFRTEA